VLHSFRGSVRVHHVDAEFGQRLLTTSSAHAGVFNNFEIKCDAYAVYETSISRINPRPPKPTMEMRMEFADMVSAFPYYLPSTDADVFTTVSCKQLGAYPVLGILCINKQLRTEGFFRQNDASILDIRRHLDARDRNETAHTAAIPLYADLLRRLERYERETLITKIDARREMLLRRIPKELVVGEGPVLTVRLPNGGCDLSMMTPLDAAMHKFNVYCNRCGDYQLFLWSGDDKSYEQFYQELPTL